MTNLGVPGIKQHLKDQAKKTSQLERGMGGLLRPKAGVPSSATSNSVNFDTQRSNELHRYGNRLCVWTFSLAAPIALAGNTRLAQLPDGFFPSQPVLFTAWANVGSAVGVAFCYIQTDGGLYFAGATVDTTTSVSGNATWTSVL